MSQRQSGFERMPVDLYQTPGWVFHALAQVVDFRGMTIWEPAAGEGKLATAMREVSGVSTFETDIMQHGNTRLARLFDFISTAELIDRRFDGIVTNPAFGPQGKTAEKFIEWGLKRSTTGPLCLLLPGDFDAASTRARFFADCPEFAGRVTLTKRIEWFPDYRSPCKTCDSRGYIDVDTQCPKCRGRGSNKVGPSSNHAWFLWQRLTSSLALMPRQPKVWYAPKGKKWTRI